MALMDRLTLYERIRDKVSNYSSRIISSATNKTESPSAAEIASIPVNEIIEIFVSILGEELVCTLLLKGLFQQIHYIPKVKLNEIDKLLSSKITQIKKDLIARQQQILLETKFKHQIAMAAAAIGLSKTQSKESTPHQMNDDSSNHPSSAVAPHHNHSLSDSTLALLPTIMNHHDDSTSALMNGTNAHIAADKSNNSSPQLTNLTDAPQLTTLGTDVSFSLSVSAVAANANSTTIGADHNGANQSTSDISDLSSDILINIFRHLDMKSVLSCERTCSYFHHISTQYAHCFSHFKYQFGLNDSDDYMFEHFNQLNGIKDPFRRFRQAHFLHLKFYQRHDRESRLLKAIGTQFRNVRRLIIQITPERSNTLIYLDWLAKKNGKFFNSVRDLILILPQQTEEMVWNNYSAHSTYKSQLPIVLRQCAFLRTLTLNCSFLAALYRSMSSSCLELTQIRCIKINFIPELDDAYGMGISNLVYFKEQCALVQYGRHIRHSFLSYFARSIESIHIHGRHALYDDMSTDDVRHLHIYRTFTRFPLLRELCISFSNNADHNSKMVDFFCQHLVQCPLLTKLNIIFGFSKIDTNLLDSLLSHFVTLNNFQHFTSGKDDTTILGNHNDTMSTDRSEINIGGDQNNDGNGDGNANNGNASNVKQLNIRYINIYSIACSLKSNVKLLNCLTKHFAKVINSSHYQQSFPNAGHHSPAYKYRPIFEWLHIHLDLQYDKLESVKKCVDILKNEDLFQSPQASYELIARKVVNTEPASQVFKGISAAASAAARTAKSVAEKAAQAASASLKQSALLSAASTNATIAEQLPALQAAITAAPPTSPGKQVCASPRSWAAASPANAASNHTTVNTSDSHASFSSSAADNQSSSPIMNVKMLPPLLLTSRKIYGLSPIYHRSTHVNAIDPYIACADDAQLTPIVPQTRAHSQSGKVSRADDATPSVSGSGGGGRDEYKESGANYDLLKAENATQRGITLTSDLSNTEYAAPFTARVVSINCILSNLGGDESIAISDDVSENSGGGNNSNHIQSAAASNAASLPQSPINGAVSNAAHNDTFGGILLSTAVVHGSANAALNDSGTIPFGDSSNQTPQSKFKFKAMLKKIGTNAQLQLGSSDNPNSFRSKISNLTRQFSGGSNVSTIDQPSASQPHATSEPPTLPSHMTSDGDTIGLVLGLDAVVNDDCTPAAIVGLESSLPLDCTAEMEHKYDKPTAAAQSASSSSSSFHHMHTCSESTLTRNHLAQLNTANMSKQFFKVSKNVSRYNVDSVTWKCPCRFYISAQTFRTT